MTVSVQNIIKDPGFKNASRDMNAKDKNDYLHILISHCEKFPFMPIDKNINFMNILLGYGADGKCRGEHTQGSVSERFMNMVDKMI